MSLARFLCVWFVVAVCVMPQVMYAADDIEVAGWIPYWAVKDGTKSALRHLDTLDAVYPFIYTVKQDGTLKDNGDITRREWKKLFREAEKKGVDVIPTIMSGDRALIESILLDPQKRDAHIDEIADAVDEGDFDGIDIDYENRTKHSIDAFSVFLKDLKKALGEKTLVCTLEPRTPPDSLWKNPPSPLPYSNDYDEIRKHCDVIQIMTYDQQRADLKLNESKAGQPYFPNADTDWVEKVVEHTIKELPKEKIMLGVPTYGRHMGVTVSPNWFQSYASIGAVNEKHALAIAKQHKVKPSMNRAGEKVVTYLPSTMPKKVANAIKKMKVDREVSDGMKAAMQTLAYANKTGETAIVNMVWWSDAPAIADKIAVADDHELRGIAIFKIDGEEDPDIWKLFK